MTGFFAIMLWLCFFCSLQDVNGKCQIAIIMSGKKEIGAMMNLIAIRNFGVAVLAAMLCCVAGCGSAWDSNTVKSGCDMRC